jgi:hypothetical protein
MRGIEALLQSKYMQNQHTRKTLLPFEYHYFTVLVKTVEAGKS